jgi:hypothetical protein
MEIPAPRNGTAANAARPTASDSVSAHRFSTPVVRELTARDMDEQRRLVRASLLPAPRASIARPAPQA